MKKRWGAIILLLCMLINTTACTTPKTTSATEPEATSGELPTLPDYKQGTFTKSEYASEWLNLRMRFPGDYEASPETVEAMNETRKGKSKQILEMHLQSRNKINGGYNIIAIIVEQSDIENIELFAEQCKANAKEADSIIKNRYHLDVERTWSRDDYFQLVGETYLLLRSHSVVHENSYQSRESVSWYLIRKIGDRYAYLQCLVGLDKSGNGEDEILRLLNLFTSYDGRIGNSQTGPLNSPDHASTTEQNTNTDTKQNGVPNNTSGSSTGDWENNSTESPTETPASTSPKRPAENPPSTSAERPAENPPSTSAERPAENPPSTSAEKPAENPPSTSAERPAENSPSTSAETTQNNDPCANGHRWIAIEKTVHHDEQGHYELVEKAKKVTKYRCAVCRNKFSNIDDYYLHFDSEHIASYPAGDPIHYLRDQYYTVGDWEYYQTNEWVVDKPAYDEIVVVGYRCTVCDKTR